MFIFCDIFVRAKKKMILKNKALNENKVSNLIADALEDQRNDFHAQIKGLVNIIASLSRRIEALEGMKCKPSQETQIETYQKPKKLSNRFASKIPKSKTWRL